MIRNLLAKTIGALFLLLCIICSQKVHAQYYDRSFVVSGNVECDQDVYLDANSVMIIEDGSLFIFGGRNFVMAPGAQIMGRKANGELYSLGEGSGRIVFKPAPVDAPRPQSLDGGNSGADLKNTIPVMEIDNGAGVSLTNSHSRTGSNLIFTQGHLVLNDKDMTIGEKGNISGADLTKFVVSPSQGHLVKEKFSTSFDFPVGKAVADFTPATITPVATNTVHVNVNDYNYSTSVEVGTDGMGRTWNIFANNSGGANISLQHNTVTNQSGFKTSANYVTRYGTSPNNTGSLASLDAWQVNAFSVSTIVGSTERNALSYTSLPTSATANEAWYTKRSKAASAPDLIASFDWASSTFQLQTPPVTTERNMVIYLREINGISTNGSEIEFRLTQNAYFDIVFDKTINSIDNGSVINVNNPNWTFTTTPLYYSFKTNSIITAYNLSTIGVTVKVKPTIKASAHTTIAGTIVGGSGGETVTTNNSVSTSADIKK